MITYTMWDYFCDFEYWGATELGKMVLYSSCCLLSLITIPLDILFSPFEIMGIIIYFITRRKE